jgi:mannose-1-phosphate guanylyltransferase
MYIVILAGGSGTRFWPLSRKRTPKQLMSVFGGKSMLQRTVERTLPLNPKRILIVTNTVQAQETAAQVAGYQEQVPIDVIEEPVGRNTAPAIGLAAWIIARHDPAGVMVVLPADHYIADEEGFRRTLLAAREPAQNGYLVTLGITPTRPETGYGYIEADTANRGTPPYPVQRFVEKPVLARALEFLAAGNFFWNSGMFVWTATTIISQLQQYMPQLATALDGLASQGDIREPAELQPQICRIYGSLPAESIDYGVMEKADNVQVIPGDFGWSDVGSWTALPEVLPADDDGMVAVNVQQLVTVDAENCLVYGADRLVALVGVRDLVVVNTPDALLVCHRERAQEVKKVVERLEADGAVDYL